MRISIGSQDGVEFGYFIDGMNSFFSGSARDFVPFLFRMYGVEVVIFT